MEAIYRYKTVFEHLCNIQYSICRTKFKKCYWIDTSSYLASKDQRLSGFNPCCGPGFPPTNDLYISLYQSRDIYIPVPKNAYILSVFAVYLQVSYKQRWMINWYNSSSDFDPIVYFRCIAVLRCFQLNYFTGLLHEPPCSFVTPCVKAQLRPAQFVLFAFVSDSLFHQFW